MVKIAQARKDPCEFLRYVWGFDLKPFHVRWQESITEHKHILIMAPRGHGKTTAIEGRILWELGRNPNLRIKIACQSDEKAVERLTNLTKNIEYEPKVREVFPCLIPADRGDWSKHKIHVKRTDTTHRDASIEAVGITATATGGRADLIIFDDVVDARNALTQPKLREMIKLTFDSVWMNMLTQHGRAVYICTPWHLDDLTHKILKSDPTFHVIKDVIESPDKPIWPEWIPASMLTEHFQRNRREFDRNYRLIPLSDEDALFPAHFVDACKDFTLSSHLVPHEWPKFIGVDLAISKSDKADYTVLFVLAIDPQRRVVPVEVQRARMNSPEAARALIALHERYHPRVVTVESNQYQASLQQWLHEIGRRDIPIKAFTTTGRKKADPYEGLPALSVEFENRNWRIPMGNGGPHRNDPMCGCGICVWLQELTSFPVAKHDDTVMASWFAREAARLGSGGHAVVMRKPPSLAERSGLAAIMERI